MYYDQVDRQMMPHPVLRDVRQISSNQIMFSYDQRTDLESAIKISNYWIRGNGGPGGAASLGMGEMLTSANAISADMGVIRPVGNTKMNFIMTFRNPIMSHTLHVVLPCFVSLEGMTGYTGGNWGPYSMNMFVGI